MAGTDKPNELVCLLSWIIDKTHVHVKLSTRRADYAGLGKQTNAVKIRGVGQALSGGAFGHTTELVSKPVSHLSDLGNVRRVLRLFWCWRS